MFKVPEKFRLIEHSTPSDGNNGVFHIKSIKLKRPLNVIASDGMGWEHVSVSSFSNPTWNEMNFIKDLFWGEEDRVVQFHPPKSEYINNHPNCLHLWRQIDQEFPYPPKIMVGTNCSEIPNSLTTNKK